MTSLMSVAASCGPLLLTIFSLLILIDSIISLELLELSVPAHVALGTRAALSCRWALGPTDLLYSVKWYKDGKEFFHHVPRDHEPRRMFSLPGVEVEKSDASGSSLILSAAVLETGGRYRCEVSGERPLFPTVSGHADMIVVVLPAHGPVILGLRSRYYMGDRVQVKCTSDQSRPSNQLSWYINGEPAPAAAVLPPIYQISEDQLETTTLLLDFVITKLHFKSHRLKVKCLATLASLYWRSNEESALLEKAKVYNKPASATSNPPITNPRTFSTRSDLVQPNLAQFLTSSSSIIVILLLAAFCIRLC